MGLTVAKHMTRMPHSIGSEQSLSAAESEMAKHSVRHLPVLHGGKLIGVITDRDIKFAKSLKDLDASKLSVAEVATPDPYAVSSGTSLKEVCTQMLEHKYSCTLVVDEGKLTGIFSWIDALKLIVEKDL